MITQIVNFKNMSYVVTFNREKYALDLKKLKEICLASSGQKENETELTEGYEINPETNMMEMSTKLIREVKTNGNPQNDMIIYDIVKLFIGVLLENGSDYCGENENEPMDSATALAFNTLIQWGLLIKVE